MAALAILAGGGRLPLLIAESVSARGGTVHLIPIRGEAGPEVERYPHTWVNWGQVGRMIDACKMHGNGTLVIAGRVSRPDLITVRPDFGLIRNIPAIARILGAGGDNNILTRVIALIESQGITVKGVHEVAPELVAGSQGAAVQHLPPDAARDIDTGARLLATLADLDVGQAVVMADGRAVAIWGAGESPQSRSGTAR
jgi:DUF1009 family protein